MHPTDILLLPFGLAMRHRRPDEAKSITHAPQLQTPNRIEVSSASFDAGGEIPDRCCGFPIGHNVSPAFAWGPPPQGTRGLVMVMEDVDNPARTPRVHMVAAFAPSPDSMPEGALVRRAAGVSFLRLRGMPGRYAGPQPPPGHGVHHYRYHLYALDAPVDLAQVGALHNLPAALGGHVLAHGMVIGTRAG
jgi:phosphatidylethanolamine-binding protein (PEBP) family uncharacterized protein